MCDHSGIVYHEEDYPQICKMFNTVSLTKRRTLADMKFLFKLANGGLDSRLIELLNFYVPSRTCRKHNVFRTDTVRINAFKYSCINRLQCTFNELSLLNIDLDINFNTFSNFVTNLLSAIPDF